MSSNNQAQFHLPCPTVVNFTEGHGQGQDTSKLPTVIGATKDGMISSFTTMAVVATLLASTEGVFLSIIKSSSQEPSPKNSKQLRTMVTLTYLAILLNIGASWSALRMIDILGKMTFLVAKRNVHLFDETGQVCSFELRKVQDVAEAMKQHGLSGIWSVFSWHCYISLCLGSLCVVTQILVYIWMNEDVRVFIAMTILAGIASTPMILSVFL